MLNTLLAARRRHLAQLERACRDGVPAEFVSRRDGAPARQGRLAALRGDAVVLHWTPAAEEPLPQHGDGIEVRFTCDDEPLSFFAEVRAAGQPEESGRCALTLRPPLRIDRVEQRRHGRRSFATADAPRTRLTCMADQDRAFAGCLVDISDGGLAVIAAIQDVRMIQPGDLFWAEFELPHIRPAFEFVVQPAQWRVLADRHVRIGWTFYPEDCAGELRRQLDRLNEALTRPGQNGRSQAPGRR